MSANTLQKVAIDARKRKLLLFEDANNAPLSRGPMAAELGRNRQGLPCRLRPAGERLVKGGVIVLE